MHDSISMSRHRDILLSLCCLALLAGMLFARTASAADIADASSPRYLTPPAPAYPAKSLRRGEEGTVMLRVTIGVDGGMKAVSLHRSSGFPLLDAAALDSMRDARFIPGSTPSGEAVEMRVIVPILFRLEDADAQSRPRDPGNSEVVPAGG